VGDALITETSHSKFHNTALYHMKKEKRESSHLAATNVRFYECNMGLDGASHPPPGCRMPSVMSLFKLSLSFDRSQ
jgi:hypothetical protein